MTDVQPDAQTALPHRSPWWLAFRVIDEPGEVFRSLAAKPRALIPIILLVLAAATAAFGTPSATLRDRARVQATAMAQRAPDRFDADKQAQMIAQADSTKSRVVILLAGSVMGLLVLLIVAGVLQLIFGAIGKERLRYKDEFAIVTHAYVPQVLGAILLVALWRFGNMPDLQLSLGFLFRDNSGFPHQLANQFTLFGAWNVFLLALGNQIRTGMKGLGAPLGIVGGLWIVVNFALAGAGAAFGGGMG